jgi:biopolymer transport protein ExbB
MNLPLPMPANLMQQLLAALLLLFSCSPSHAWWNKDWTQRTRLVLDTTAQGVPTREPVPSFALAVRLHSGNFDFFGAKPDGSDLRFVAADDKTPLAFRIERWDATNELAVVWVQLPNIAPGSNQNIVYAYAGHAQAAADSGNATGFDPATQAALLFASTDGADAAGRWRASEPITLDDNGLLGAALRAGGQAADWPANEAVRTAAGAELSVVLWVKPDAVNGGSLLRQGPLAIGLKASAIEATVAGATLSGGSAAPGAWTHIALTLGAGKAVLYVGGTQVAQADIATPAIEGPLRLGEGFNGRIDTLQIATTRRGSEWVALAAASQGIDGKLVSATLETQAQADAGSPGYIGVLVKNLTVDAWVVILICGLMLLVAMWVMVAKALFVNRADKANRGFLRRFRDAQGELLELAAHPEQHRHSSIFRLYAAGVRELNKRNVGVAHQTPALLSGASLNAVKAAVDADVVRESHRLNSQMVLLTIAISGGPFLGLLGTVIGVMITFAAIAAAGDVNVNAIAPGIAAALLATVAGLGVAIPALFGYNYLATRIKNISADMQIFVDEFITRVAELHGAP